MAKTKKRVLSLVLSLAMLLTLLPAIALADEGHGTFGNKHTFSSESSAGVSVDYTFDAGLEGTKYGTLLPGQSETFRFYATSIRKVDYRIKVPAGYTAGASFTHTINGEEKPSLYTVYKDVTNEGYVGAFEYTLIHKNGDVVFKILTNPIEYSVSYDAMGGVYTSTDTNTYQHSNLGPSEITVLADEPTKEGYRFLGWKLKGAEGNSLLCGGDTFSVDDYWMRKAVVGDITDGRGEFVLEAQWEEIPVVEDSAMVRFYVEGTGTPGYNLTGVTDKNGNLINAELAAAGNLYVENNYIVVGDPTAYGTVVAALAEGETVTNAAAWIEEHAIAMPNLGTVKAAVDAAKAANGWTDIDFAVSGYENISVNKVTWEPSDSAYHVHLQLDPTTYTVTYNGNGGTADEQPIKTVSWDYDAAGYTVAADANGFTNGNHIFGGWYTDASCTTPAPAVWHPTLAEESLTLYAKWNAPSPINEGGENDYAVVEDPEPTDQNATTQGSATIKVYRDGQYVEGQDIEILFAGDSADVSFTAANKIPGIGTDYILSSIACDRKGGKTEMTINANGNGSVKELKDGEVLYLFYSTTFTVDGVVRVTGKDGNTYNVPFSQVPALQNETGRKYVMAYRDGNTPHQGAVAVLYHGTNYPSTLQAVSTEGQFSKWIPDIPVEGITSVKIAGNDVDLEKITDKDVFLPGYPENVGANQNMSFSLNISDYLIKDCWYKAATTAAIAGDYTFYFTINATEKVEKFNLYGWLLDDGSGLDFEELDAYNRDKKYVSPNWEQLDLVKGTNHSVTFYAPEGLVITAYQQKGGEKISLIEDGKGKPSHTCYSDGEGVAFGGNTSFSVYLTKDENGDLIPDRDQFTVTWKNYDGTVLEVDKNVTAGTMPQYNGLTPVKPADMYYVYTFAGWTPELAPVSGNVEYTAVFTSAYIPPYIPPVDPPVDIEDPDVPLADLPGLNTVDHYAYIAGYPDGTVQPNGNITRAEVATIFFRLFTEEYRNTFWSVSAPFTDVKTTDWFNTEVATVASAGVINGYPDGSFMPNSKITRAEFATIAARFLSEEYVGPDLFTDVSGHWAQEYINRAANAGWINGYPDGSFRPDAYITRAEAMTLVNNMLGRVPHEDHLLAGMKVWADNASTMWYYEAVQEATNGHDYDWAEDYAYEIWTALTPDLDWEALEALWTAQNT